MRRAQAAIEKGAVGTHVSPNISRLGAAPELLQRISGRLREIERSSGIDKTLSVGELILTEFFNGDPIQWRDRSRNKNNSIRRLAERVDCPFGRSALNDAVAIYVATLAMPDVRTFGHICSSHISSVLLLAAPERAEMLQRAETEHWSVRELKAAVTKARREGGERRGRPTQEASARALSSLRSTTTRLRSFVSELRHEAQRSLAFCREALALSADLTALGAQLRALAKTSSPEDELGSTANSVAATIPTASRDGIMTKN